MNHKLYHQAGLIWEEWVSEWSRSAVSDSVRPHRLQPTRLPHPWDSPGKNTGVGCHFLLQGIFPTQGSNPGLPRCRQIPYQLSHKVSPRILEWVDYPFSSGSSLPRNRTGVSCIAGGFFINWSIREAWCKCKISHSLSVKTLSYQYNK